MQQATQTNTYEEDKIYFKKIINQLIASKLIIIIITLLFTILSTYITLSKPPSFSSTAQIEIGQYKIIDHNEQEEKFLIENVPLLLQELKIAFVHKKQSAVSGVALSFSEIPNTGRLININAAAPSIEEGEELLNEITTYIQKRHEKIIIKLLDSLNINLEQLNSRIEFNNGRLISKLKNTSYITKLRINEINQEIPIIDKKISTLKLAISEETANLRLLESNPKLLIQRAAVQPTLNQIIHSYKISMLDFESESLNLENELLDLQHSLTEINIALKGESYSSYDKPEVIFRLIQEKNILEHNIQSLKIKTPSSELIGEIESGETKSRITLFVLLGFIIGLMLSIILVIFIGKFKDYKEKN